jgi:very-short-patch-repair endonuclease
MEGKIGADHVIAALAGKQAGRVSREQLLGQGIGAKAIDHRLRQGRLHVEHRGVFAVGHAVSSVEGRWWAALLACGEDAVLSHMTAAVAWALAIAGDGPVEVTAPHSRQQLHGVRRHSSRSLGEHDRTELRGMPITTPERTVLDLASRLPDRRLERLLDRGEQLRLLDLRDLRRSLTEHSRRAGTPRLRRVLERFAPTVTRSELEERFLELCAEQGLPRPQMNAVVAGFEVDAYWPRAKLVAELDGYAFHRSPDAFERDRARDVALTLAGLRVIRLTWRGVTTDAHDTGAAIRRLLAGEPSSPR